MHGVAVLSKGKITVKPYEIPTPATKRKTVKEYKLTQREKWLLEGKFKILGLPKKAKKLRAKKYKPFGFEAQKTLFGGCERK